MLRGHADLIGDLARIAQGTNNACSAWKTVGLSGETCPQFDKYSS